MRALILSLLLVGCQSCTSTPQPAPVPTPTPAPSADAGPMPAMDATSRPDACSVFESMIGAMLVCVGFEVKQTPGAVLTTIDATCASKGVAAARTKLAAMDTQHKCNMGAKK